MNAIPPTPEARLAALEAVPFYCTQHLRCAADCSHERLDPPMIERPDYPALAALVEAWLREQDEEIARLELWVGDLQCGLFINCVYCGFRYGPGESTPATLPEAGETLAATALREHVERCPDHPMSRLKAKLAAQDAAGRALVEALDTADDLYSLGESSCSSYDRGDLAGRRMADEQATIIREKIRAALAHPGAKGWRKP